MTQMPDLHEPQILQSQIQIVIYSVALINDNKPQTNLIRDSRSRSYPNLQITPAIPRFWTYLKISKSSRHFANITILHITDTHCNLN